ncbi:TadE family protein [Burkholderiales bacterium]|nr:TadE family protein [Burkholderiales bacterium]
MKSSLRFPALRCAAKRTGPDAQRGVTMVEFAIVSPLALLLVLGIVQLGLMLVAKEIVNEAAFVAARAGAVDHAQTTTMTSALQRALVPFYQDTTDSNDYTRLGTAWVRAQLDLGNPLNLDLKVLNPSPEAFADFGLSDTQNHTYIPNDSLEYRTHARDGQSSGQSIQDANALKIRVTYAYELKVPLMRVVFQSVMCNGPDAFGRGGGSGLATALECQQYYSRGRVPIVTYATVQMQTPAWSS